jgi:hypothetical protein
MEPNCIITAPVVEFCLISGLGRTKIYELLGEGTLASIKVGKRRLIVLDSYRALIRRQLEIDGVRQEEGPSPRDASAGARLSYRSSIPAKPSRRRGFGKPSLSAARRDPEPGRNGALSGQSAGRRRPFA